MIALSLILPVINEEKIIEAVVNDIVKVLSKAKLNYELILVENSSTDNTLQVLKELAKKNKRLLVKIAPRGYGSSVLSGFKSATGKYVGYMPSDGQIDPKVIPLLLRLLKTKGINLVKVKRVSRENFVRTYNSRIYNLLANLFFQLNTNDINGDPKIFLRRDLSRLKLKSKDSFLSTELLIKAKYLQWKMKEVPIESLPRVGGKSTVSILTIFEFLRNLFTWRFGTKLNQWKKLINPKPIKTF